MYNNVELLSPVGSWEALVAAVQNGADAVYLGGKHHNARKYASNFDEEQLKKAVDYCHARDVAVYLTLNTLLNDKELKELYKYIAYIYNIGIDAVIVQDIGVAKLIRSIAPKLHLHASTQMTVYNLDGVNMLKELGFSRVVLARELSLEQIEYICQNTDVEIEVFVHGALCMCYSGQCLMSSMIGGRSGNRGCCAQPCRLPYDLVNLSTGNKVYQYLRDKYLLSPKDLSLINYLKPLEKAGVKSLKIEGRMKRPEYVAVVTRIYRDCLDSGQKINQEDMNALLQIFNRGGFTQGYLTQTSGPDMMSLERPNNWGINIGEVISYNKGNFRAEIKLTGQLNVGDGIEIWTKDGQSYGSMVSCIWGKHQRIKTASSDDIVQIEIKGRISSGDKVYKTSDSQLNREAKQTFDSNANIKKVPIYGHYTIKLGKPIYVSFWDDCSNFVEYTGVKIAEKALNKPLDGEKVKEQLMKAGDSPFTVETIEINMEEEVSLPVSEINAARRNALSQLEQKRILKYRPSFLLKEEELHSAYQNVLLQFNKDKAKKELKLSVQVREYSQAVELIHCDFDRIYLPAGMLADKKDRQEIYCLTKQYISKGIDVVYTLPRVILRNEVKLYQDLIGCLDEFGIHMVAVGNIGLINMVKKNAEYKLIGDYSLNIFNSVASVFYKELGFESITLSPELNFKQIKNLYKISDMGYEIIGYGRLPLMITENCAVKNASAAAGEKPICNCTDVQYALKDRKGAKFPIVKDKLTCRSEILNSQVLFLADRVDDIQNSGIDSVRLMFTTEPPEVCREVTEFYINALKFGEEALQKHSELLRKIEKEGFTRGHYYRGV